MKNLLARAADRPTLQLVVIFVVLDVIALLCASLFTIDALDSRFFKLGRDRGLGEFFEYGKFALIIYMLLEFYRANGDRVFRAWMILFSVMLADNFIGIHEEVGELIASYFELPDVGFNRPKDLAEILVFAVLEGTAALYVVYCYLHSESAGRYFSQRLCMVFGIFVFCALILDAAGPRLLEEGGEMVGMTLILGWLHNYFRQEGLLSTAAVSPA